MKKHVALALMILLAALAGCSGTAPAAESFIAENRTINSNSSIVDYNGTIYFSNNQNLFSFDGATTSIAMKQPPDGVPLFFYICDSKLVYINNYTPKIYLRALNSIHDNTLEKSFGNVNMDRIGYDDLSRKEKWYVAHYSHFVAAEGHVFFKGKDKTLHRITIDGTNEKVICRKDVDDLTYSYGYVYFVDQKSTLLRIKSDGTKLQKVTTNPIDRYYITNTGVIYITRGDSCYLLNSDNLEERKLNEMTDPDISHLSFFDIDDHGFYITTSYDDGLHDEIIRIPIHGGNPEVIFQCSTGSISTRFFPPVLLNGYIYFYSEQFYRVRTDGTGLQQIGPAFIGTRPM